MSTAHDQPEVDEALARELLKRVGTLRRHIASRIPARDRTLVSVDDVLQDLWVAAQRAIGSFRPDGPDALDRWLRVMADTVLYNHIRVSQRLKRGGNLHRVSNAHEPVGSYVDLFEAMLGRGVTPSKEARAADVGQAVLLALKQLHEPRRRALELHFIKGLAFKEVAERMGRTEAAARSLAHAGLRDLRTMLGDAARYFSDIRPPEPSP